jgi:hypothetical protein
LSTDGPIRSKSEHGDTEAAEPPQSSIDGVLTDVAPGIAVVGTAAEKTGYTRGLNVPLLPETERCRTEEPQTAESTSLNKRGSDNWEQPFRERLPGSERDPVRSAGAHIYAGREEAIRSGDQEQTRVGKFPRIRKRIALGALCTVIGVSVSIAGFSIVRSGRDAEPTTTRVQSNISSRTEAVAIPGADSSQVHKPSRPAEPDSAGSGTLQRLAVGVRETGSAAQQELGAPQRSNVGQVNASQQSTDPAIAPRDAAQEPSPSVAQALSATPKGSAETAPHSVTGQPAEVTPKDKAKATATVPTRNVSAALPSRADAAKRRKASTSRRDTGSRRYIRRQTPPKHP